MTSQTIVPNGQVIGIYNDRKSAKEMQQAIESAGISAQKVSIDDHVAPGPELEALGTTAGGEAGFLMGAFYGGTLGVIAIVIGTIAVDGLAANSSFNRLLIVGLTAVGAIAGLIYGKQVYAAQPKEQKQKSDPSIPRTFRVVVSGSRSEVEQAMNVVHDIEVNSQ